MPNITKMYLYAFRYMEIKINQHDAGHITKMVATPIYGKNLSTISSREPVDLFPRKLVCSIGDSILS